MPKSRILFVFAIALIGAALTVLLAVAFGGVTDQHINPRLIVGALLVALVVRVWLMLRAKRAEPDAEE